MMNFEVVSIIIAVTAVLISLASLWYARSANGLAKTANELAKNSLSLESANVELYINERITNTKERVTDVMVKLADLERDESKKIEMLRQALGAFVENNINAYEEACAKYRDGKVDKERFEKMYHVEIRNLVENKSHEQYFDGIRSPYKAILMVYEQWNNKEK